MICLKDHERELNRKDAEITQLRYELNKEREVSASYDDKMKIYQEMKLKYETLVTKLREQNEADLIHTSLKIAFDLISGKKKKHISELIKQREIDECNMRNLEALSNMQRQALNAGLGSLGGLGIYR